MAKAVNPSGEFSLAALWRVIGVTGWANGNEGGICSGASMCTDEWGWKCMEKVIHAPVETVSDSPIKMHGYELCDCE